MIRSVLISDRNRSMLSASSISAANCFTRELDLEYPLRSFSPDAGKEMDDTHQDAEPLAPIVCVTTSFQPMIEFPAITENFPVQDEPPVREVLRSEEHTSELQSLRHLVCRLLLEKKTPH